MDVKREFSSYSALDREAMILGVPLLPFISTLIIALVFSYIALLKFGIIGIAFALFVIPIILFMRTLVANDDKAIRLLMIETSFKFKRKAFRQFNHTLTFMPTRYLRNEGSIEQIIGDHLNNTR